MLRGKTQPLFQAPGDYTATATWPVVLTTPYPDLGELQPPAPQTNFCRRRHSPVNRTRVRQRRSRSWTRHGGDWKISREPDHQPRSAGR